MNQIKVKRSQAAMEFLMTYGWAIMMVILALAALAKFGVFDIGSKTQERCDTGVGLACEDFKIQSSNNSAYFKLVNGLGKGVIIYNVSLDSPEDFMSGCVVDFKNNDTACDKVDRNGTSECRNKGDPDTYGYNGKMGVYVPLGESLTIHINCSSIDQYEGVQKSNLHLTWYYADSDPVFAKTIEGEILGKAY